MRLLPLEQNRFFRVDPFSEEVWFAEKFKKVRKGQNLSPLLEMANNLLSVLFPLNYSLGLIKLNHFICRLNVNSQTEYEREICSFLLSVYTSLLI